MGCAVSTETVPSIFYGEGRKKFRPANKSASVIDHCDECETQRENSSKRMTSAFTIQLPDVEMPLVANSSDSAATEEQISNLQDGELFQDETFPAENKSLFYSTKPIPGEIEWLRPWEIVERPKLQVDGTHRSDMVQGILGDCWFLSSCVAVSQYPKLIRRVIPEDQTLFGGGYNGAIKFNFWRFGEWITVYIDDRLPTVDGKLFYARSSNQNEFWVSLVEKAYAKLHGCYESIAGGQSMDALVDLTSGIAERYDLEDYQNNNKNLFRYLARGSKSGALITCSRKGDWKNALQADPNGLVSGHAYTITYLKIIRYKSNNRENLLRIRNPWGDATEWNGAWNDSDSIWDEVDESIKNEIQYKNRPDGEFWMTMDDFCTEFEEVSICTIGPDFDGDGIVDIVGQVKAIKGGWLSGKNAGGSRNNIESFAKNPQYLMTLSEPDNNHDGSNDVKDKCSIVVALMQENRRSSRHLGIGMLQIGFVIYQVTKTKRKLTKDFFLYHYDSGTSGSYINYREVIGRFDLSPGNYIIIPATFEPECPANFMIRMYAEKSFSLRELL